MYRSSGTRRCYIPLTLAEGALAGASQQPSREFLKYRQRHAEWLALFDGDEPPVGSPEYAALMDLQGVRGDAMWAAIDPIMTRTARSWDDVIELARVVYDQLYEEVGKHSYREDIEYALLKAIFAMAERGALNS